MGEPSHRRPRLMGVGRSAAGATADEETVRALYATHATALTSFVTGLVGGDRARAEDIVQETMLRAWRSPQVLADDRGSTRSWLFTVARNLAIARKASPYRAWSLGEIFGIFSALEYPMDREAENLSGGEMQMAAIARALLGSPGLLLLDEPSQGLAPMIVANVLSMIERLKHEGLGVLVVEQNAELALSIADRVYVLDLGRIVYAGPAAELRDDTARRRQLLGA